MKAFKGLRIIYLAAIASLTAGVDCWSQTAWVDTLGFSVFFRQGHSDVDLEFRDNAYNLEIFADVITGLQEDPLANVKSIYIEAAASPEGASDLNERLAADRADNIRTWLLENTPLYESQIHTGSIGVDWDGLAALLAETEWEHRDTVLSIISDTPIWVTRGGEVVGGRKKALMELYRGEAWSWMLDSIFPVLRQGGAAVKCFVVRQPDPLVLRDTVYISRLDTVYLGEPAPQPVVLEPIFAVRSNLLVPLMNIGFEVPLGNRWSVGADWYYTWAWRKWFKDLDMTNCLQMLAGGVDVRYWFGSRHTPDIVNRQNRLWGHSVGAYGYAGYYDFEYDYKGYQGEFTNVGLDYMYSARLGKRNGLRMELSLGVGYIHSKAREYNVYNAGGNAFRTGNVKNVNWIGPTKATVSLVVPINRKVKYEQNEPK